MKNQESAIVFDQERASSYDKQFAKLAPMRDALHLLIRMVLSKLPDVYCFFRLFSFMPGIPSELLNEKSPTMPNKALHLIAYSLVENRWEMDREFKFPVSYFFNSNQPQQQEQSPC